MGGCWSRAEGKLSNYASLSQGRRKDVFVPTTILPVALCAQGGLVANDKGAEMEDRADKAVRALLRDSPKLKDAVGAHRNVTEAPEVKKAVEAIRQERQLTDEQLNRRATR